MKVFRDFKGLDPSSQYVITIGNFDGVHTGHQKILRRVRREAKRLKVLSAVVTFDVHPRKVIYGDRHLRLLNFLSHKLCSLQANGIESCFLLSFTPRFRNLSKEAFLSRFIKKERIRKVVVGYDFHFGCNRQGSLADIRAYCRKTGILFETVRAALYRGQPVSSNRIRQMVASGDLKKAAQCLGRPYSVIGEVVRGSGIGRKMGMPTANVKVASEIFPPEGVYFVWARPMQGRPRSIYPLLDAREGKGYRGLAYRGPLPQFNQRENESILEVSLYDFKGSLYGRYMEVFFIQFIRKPVVVKRMEELEALIRRDMQMCRRKNLDVDKILNG